MPLKQIIPIVITIVAVVIFGVVLGVNYFEQSFPDGIVEVEAPSVEAANIFDITSKQKFIESLLLDNVDLTSESDLIKNETTYQAWNNALAYLYDSFFASYNRVPVNITFSEREQLLDSMTNTIRQIPYFNKWGLYERSRQLETYRENGINFKNAIKEQVGMYLATIFDLNPVTNPDFNKDGVSNDYDEQELRRIKDKIKNALNLTDWYARTWDDFSILIGPGIFGTDDIEEINRVKESFHKIFSVYQNTSVLIGHGRLLYGGVYPPSLWSTYLAQKYRVSSSIIEPNMHGIGHEIDEYLQRQNRESDSGRYKGQVKWRRLASLGRAVDDKYEDNCRRYTTIFQSTGFNAKCEYDEDYWPWRSPAKPPDNIDTSWCADDNPSGKCAISVAEMLADGVASYMSNSQRFLNTALHLFERGYKEPINQWLFFLDIFSLTTNNGRLYALPDDAHRGFNNFQFTVVDIPLQRDGENRITSFFVNGGQYIFDYDSNDNVSNYQIKIGDRTPSTLFTTSPNPCFFLIPPNRDVILIFLG